MLINVISFRHKYISFRDKHPKVNNFVTTIKTFFSHHQTQCLQLTSPVGN